MFRKTVLKRKMWRDINKHKTQFISIFLMAFLAVFIYSGVGGEWRGLERSADNFYEETNLPEVFMMSNSFSEEEKNAISELDVVSNVERRTILDVGVDSFSNGETSSASKSSLSLNLVEKNEISKAYIVDGKEFDINDDDGIWLSKRFADANGLSIGDKITFTLFETKIEKEIKGTIYSAEHVFKDDDGGMAPNFKETGFAYVSPKIFPAPEMFVYTEMLVCVNDMSGIEDKINDAIDGSYSMYYEKSDHISVATFNNEIKQHRMMGDLFPVVFLLVALLTITTTMTRIVRNQRTQIGTLKALGFKRKVILNHYVSYGFYLSLFGSILGCVVGLFTLPKLFYPSMSGFFTLPEWLPGFHFSFILLTLFVVFACTIVTYIACGKYLKETPAQTLRPKAPKASKHSSLEKTNIWQRIGFNAQWNYRDMTRNKIRSIMAVVGVLGCTSLLICAFGMNASMDIIKEWQYQDIYKFESRINLDENATENQLQVIVDATNGETIMEAGIELRADGQKKTATATITDDVTLLVATDNKRNVMSLPEGEVSMSHKIAEALNLEVGDTFEWHLFGNEEWTKSEVAEIYRDPSTQGIMLNREAFEKLGNEYRVSAILSSDKIEKSYEGAAAVLSISDILDGWETFTESMLIMVYVLIIGAVILSIVVLYNLGVLSFTEKERDMATLKVMGLKTKKLRLLLLTQNIWLSVIGFAIGVPIGLFLIEIMVSSSGDSFDFPVELTFGMLLYSFLITFGLSIFTSLLFSNRIKRLNMVESLKGLE